MDDPATRLAIAKIIEPYANWELKGFDDSKFKSDRIVALEKADAIVALQTLDTQGEVSQGDGLADEQKAREILAAAWGDHPQWADVRARILDGSCSIHSDTLSLSCSIATSAVRSALSSTDQRAEEREWQPIETAPKDGTPLLLFARCKTATAPVVLVGWHLPDEGWIESSFTRPVGVVPTHWMPLPSSPVGDEGDG